MPSLLKIKNDLKLELETRLGHGEVRNSAGQSVASRAESLNLENAPERLNVQLDGFGR
jgi:hypothetical protein